MEESKHSYHACKQIEHIETAYHALNRTVHTTLVSVTLNRHTPWPEDLTSLTLEYQGAQARVCTVRDCIELANVRSRACASHMCHYGKCHDIVIGRDAPYPSLLHGMYTEQPCSTNHLTARYCRGHSEMSLCCHLTWYWLALLISIGAVISSLSVALADLQRSDGGLPRHWAIDMGFGIAAIVYTNIVILYLAVPMVRHKLTLLWAAMLRCCGEVAHDRSIWMPEDEHDSCLDRFMRGEGCNSMIVICTTTGWGLYITAFTVTLFVFAGLATAARRLMLGLALGMLFAALVATGSLLVRLYSGFAGRPVSACDWVCGCDPGPLLDGDDLV